MRAEDLMCAVESLDSDLIYRAHADDHPKLYVIRRLSIAAAFIALTITSVVIYSIFITTDSRIWLDSRESVAITLNSRGNVLSASGHPELSGVSAEQAVTEITKDMISTGALSKAENTLIIGSDDLSDRVRLALVKSAQDSFSSYGFDGATVSLSCSEPGAKAAVIELLSDCDENFTHEGLKGLSANELNLLLHGSDIDKGSVGLTGFPSQVKYIGFDRAASKAMALSDLSESEMTDISISYTVYRSRLVYLVRLNAGDKSEAYFINAASGATEHTIKAPSDRIDDELKTVVDSPTESPTHSESSAAAAPVYETLSASPTDCASEPTEDIHPTAEHMQTEPPTATVSPTASPPTQASTEPLSAEYISIPITLKELAFVTDIPPENAHDVHYQTLFEGQFIEPRDSERINCGEVAKITNSIQLKNFLADHNYIYTNKNGSALKSVFTEEYFKNKFIIASACTVSDASYYTTATHLTADDDKMFLENSLSYGTAHSGEYYCRMLSIYAVDRSLLSPDLKLTVY